MTAAPNQFQPGSDDVPSHQFYDGSVGAQFLAPNGPALFQYRYQQGPWQDAGEDYYNFCRKEREQGNLNFEVRALCECSTPVPCDGEAEIVDMEATFQRIDLAPPARSDVPALADLATTIRENDYNLMNGPEILAEIILNRYWGAKIDAAKTDQRCDAVIVEAARKAIMYYRGSFSSANVRDAINELEAAVSVSSADQLCPISGKPCDCIMPCSLPSTHRETPR